MTTVLALAASKGGVGKTAITISTAAALVREGLDEGEPDRRVLVVDLDPQGSATILMGARPKAANLTVLEALCVDGPSLKDVIVPTTNPSVDMAPALDTLHSFASVVAGDPSVQWLDVLAYELDAIAADYDWVLIDTPPGAGILASLALTASNLVVIPSQVDVESLRRVGEVERRVATIKGTATRPGANPHLRLLGTLPNMVQANTVATKVLLEAEAEAGERTFLSPGIPQATVVRDSAISRQAVTTYAPDAPVSLALRAFARTVLAAAGGAM